jgi:hypothetical protein
MSIPCGKNSLEIEHSEEHDKFYGLSRLNN